MKEEEWKAWGLLEDDAMRQLSMAATDPRFPLIVTAGCKMRQQDAELTRLREVILWAGESAKDFFYYTNCFNDDYPAFDRGFEEELSRRMKEK